jgi:periplasmic protein CpxP/Spy
MKKLIMIAIIFSLSFTAFGQRGQQREMSTPEQRAERMTNRMAEQLDLTEEQKQEIYNINLQNAQKRQVEMEERKAEMESRRAEMKSQNESQKQQIEAILTPEQKEKWDEVRSENQKRMEDRGKRGRGGSDGNKGRYGRGGYSRSK